MTQPTLHKKLSAAVSLACLGLLLIVLTTGCQQNPTVAAQNITLPTPAATLVPTISPERLASAKQLMISLGCIGCHTIDTIPEAIGIIGPDLTHVATRASATIASSGYVGKGKAKTAREYLKESILSPSAFLALECPSGPCTDFVMPRDFKTRIKADDLEAILDLLSSLE